MSKTYLLSRQMWRRPTTWLALAVWAFILGISILLVALHGVGWRGAGNTSAASGLALFLALFAFATMGALVAARVPRNAVGWIFLAIPLGGAVGGITELLAFQGLVHRPGSVPAATAWGWVYSWLWYPTVGLLGFVLILYPTGAVLGPRWRVVSWALGVTVSVTTIGYMLYPGPLDQDKRLPDNPLEISALKDVLDWIHPVAGLLTAALLVAAVISVVVRFRRSRGDERQQMKWMAFAAAVLITGLVAQPLFHLSDVLFSVTISTLPIALGIALFKYRLYDIDRLISRTISYLLVTGVLVGVFVGIVLLATRVLPFSSPVGVAASTLAAAALFNPLRGRVQGLVDRRFNRTRYDAEAVIAAFGERLRHEADLESLLTELQGTVREAFQPSEVLLWLRPQEPGA